MLYIRAASGRPFLFPEIAGSDRPGLQRPRPDHAGTGSGAPGGRCRKSCGHFFRRSQGRTAGRIRDTGDRKSCGHFFRRSLSGSRRTDPGHRITAHRMQKRTEEPRKEPERRAEDAGRTESTGSTERTGSRRPGLQRRPEDAAGTSLLHRCIAGEGDYRGRGNLSPYSPLPYLGRIAPGRPAREARRGRGSFRSPPGMRGGNECSLFA